MAEVDGRVTALLMLVVVALGVTILRWQRPGYCGASVQQRANALNAAPGEPPSGALLFGGGAMDINVASARDLEALPGIGPTLAHEIVVLRQSRGGRFESVDELLEVWGIGTKTLRKLLPYLRITDYDYEL
ncbi:MAG: helix-hairpin-helix domain-containing protein [Pseudomonadota bacterium]